MSAENPLIAVVDDEASVRQALGRLLRSARLRVETFATGGEFLESLTDHQPDCIVLDIHMPLMTGFEVQSRLAAAGSSLPVIIITGYDSAETRARSLAAGAQAYLRKPINDEDLLAAIDQALGVPRAPTSKIERKE